MEPYLPAWRLAQMTATGQIGCLELLDFYIARTEAQNPRINAVVVKDYDRARTRAKALDNAGRASAGPLFGVPMTIKESFNLTDHPTTWGFPFRKDHRATEDALAVRRLTAAGAVVFGKTNVPVGLGDWQSYNPVYGSTSNPYDLTRSPGGSSGGSAAALAAGFCGLEIGSDIGGSIRVPAHFCGVFGHKPTHGLCHPRGHSLVNSAGIPDLSVIGPLARSARDLRTALQLIAGPDDAEGTAPLTLTPPRLPSAAGLRVAVWASQPGIPQSPEITEAVEKAARALESQGAFIDRSARPAFDPIEAFQIYLALLDAALSARVPQETVDARKKARDGLAANDQSTSATMLRASGITHREWLQLHERRNHIRRAWGEFFQKFDVVLTPVAITAAFPHDQETQMHERILLIEGIQDHTLPVDGTRVDYGNILFWPGIATAFALPATAAPVSRTSTGLPIGVQIIGPILGDLTTIAVAESLETALGGFIPPASWE